MSSNGSIKINRYYELIDAGVNDFSISLDACCAADDDKMAGGIRGAWDKVVENIKLIAERTYVTVGMGFTEENIDRCVESVLFAGSLGVCSMHSIGRL